MQCKPLALVEPVGLRSLVSAPGRRNGPPRPRPCRAAGAGGWPGARPVSRKGEPTPSAAGQLRAQREGRRSPGVGAQPGAGRRPLGEPPHKRGQLRAQREGRVLRWGQRPRPRPGTRAGKCVTTLPKGRGRAAGTAVERRERATPRPDKGRAKRAFVGEPGKALARPRSGPRRGWPTASGGGPEGAARWSPAGARRQGAARSTATQPCAARYWSAAT